MAIVKKNNKCYLCDNKSVNRVESKIPSVLDGISLCSCDEHGEAVEAIFREMQTKELERQRKENNESIKKLEEKHKKESDI